MKKVIENILAYYIGLTFAFSPLIFIILYFTYTEKTIGLYLLISYVIAGVILYFMERE